MGPSSTGTVCIVDDDAQVRRFLVEILDSVGIRSQEFTSGEDFMRRWQPEEVACILLDVRMPRVTGPEVHDWLLQQKISVPVIFLSGYADVSTAVRAMRRGAFDFIEKPFNVQELIERVNSAMRLRSAPGVVQDWQAQLTPRERDVLTAIVKGQRNKIIAAELGISERTVETHRASIMAKSGAQTAAELVARTVGGTPPDPQ
jgi:FixJ family two-component response regulator